MSLKHLISSRMNSLDLTLNDVVDECKQRDVKVSVSYISQLRTGISKAPSEKILLALSEILDVDYDLLVMEEYLDKAPNKLIEFITKHYLEVEFHDEDISIAKVKDYIQNNLNDSELSNFVINGVTQSYNSNTNVFIMPDNSMAPVIQKGDILNLSSFQNTSLNIHTSTNSRDDTLSFFSSVKEGDIIVIYDLGRNLLIVGYYCFDLDDIENRNSDTFCVKSLSPDSYVRKYDKFSARFNLYTIEDGELVETDTYYNNLQTISIDNKQHKLSDSYEIGSYAVIGKVTKLSRNI